MQFTIGKRYNITDAQGTSICFECRAVGYQEESALFPAPSYFTAYFSMRYSIACVDIEAGLKNGCITLCVEAS
jgi:hypothetical protein